MSKMAYSTVNCHPVDIYGTYPRSVISNGDLSAHPSGPIRGILRNDQVNLGERFERDDDDEKDENGLLMVFVRWVVTAIDRYLCSTVAEFVAVIFTVFTVTIIENRLVERESDNLVSISVVSSVEGVCMLVFLQTFRRSHLSPAITLAHLFSMITHWPSCLLFLLMQMLGAILGIFLYQAVNVDGPLTIPSVPTEDWLRGVYRLVLCQTVGSFMVVLSHLLLSLDVEKRSGNSNRLTVVGHPVGTVGAVVVMSFVSLLFSTASWNPVRTFAICLVATLDGSGTSFWTEHYVFWLGPVIGSLFASFLYRLVFAQDKKRLIVCDSVE